MGPVYRSRAGHRFLPEWSLAYDPGGAGIVVRGGMSPARPVLQAVVTSVMIPPGGQAMVQLKLTAVGNSIGVVLPEELLAKLRVRKGDTLFALETPNGIELTRHNAEFEDQMEVAEGVMRDFRDTLRRLAE